MPYLRNSRRAKYFIIVLAGLSFCGCAALKGKNYSSLGTYCFSRGDFKKAAEYFEKAALENTKDTGYLAMLGWAYFKLGDYDQAISTFENLSQTAPNLLDGYTGQGWSYFKKSDYDRAIASFQEAIKFHPDSADAFDGLGWSNSKKGNPDQAERYFKIALKKVRKENKDVPTKTDPEAHRGLGYLSFAKGDFTAALRHFKIATLLSPDWNDARIKWGECLSALKKDKGAISVYKHALKYSKSADLYDKLGRSSFNLGRFKTARRMFKQALSIDPSHAGALSGLAEIETKLGPEK